MRKRKPSAWRPLRKKISGLVFFPRMPDINRLRTSGETTSAIGDAQVEGSLRILLRLDGFDEMRLHPDERTSSDPTDWSVSRDHHRADPVRSCFLPKKEGTALFTLRERWLESHASIGAAK